MTIQESRQQKSFNVLLIGDSCIDEYKIGSVDRLSPEAPVPVLKILETKYVPGMSDNVKHNLENLGITPDYVTNPKKIVKTRFIDNRSGQHILRVDNEPILPTWRGKTPRSLDIYDLVIISDYNKGFLTYDLIAKIISSVTCPVFIDTKKTQLEDISASHVYIKINELEYKNARSFPSNLIVTLGDKGAFYKNVNSEILIPSKKVEVVDVCGCGDTFLAAIATRFLFTNDIKESIIFANTAAAITVQHRGNYAPTLAEIRNAGH